eukprot:2359112-Rhodomonas_salina.2
MVAESEDSSSRGYRSNLEDAVDDGERSVPASDERASVKRRVAPGCREIWQVSMCMLGKCQRLISTRTEEGDRVGGRENGARGKSEEAERCEGRMMMLQGT